MIQTDINYELELLAVSWMLEDDDEYIEEYVEEPQNSPSLLEQLLSQCSALNSINSKFETLNRIRESLDNNAILVSYLRRNALYEFYRMILDYAESHLSFDSLSNNPDDITFFTNRYQLTSMMCNRGLSGYNEINSKLTSLAEIGLIKSLTDSEIRPDVLHRAYEIVNNASDSRNQIMNRANFYVLYDLTEEVVSTAVQRIELFRELGIRRRGRTAESIAIVLGEDIVNNNINVQANVSINKTKVTNFINAATLLLNQYGYFTENELRKQYSRKDHHTKKKDAIKLTQIYLPKVIIECQLIRVRVNKYYRNKFSIPNKIKNNSYIFIRKI